MKLRIVPARQGAVWVKMGMRTFFKQPLALSGLFVIFMAAMSLLSLLPVLGSVIALTVMPAATLGLMAATRETTKGKFPMPTVLLSGFRAGRQQLRGMLVLGALYAAGFLLVMLVSSVADGGQFARLYLLGGELTTELVQRSDFIGAAMLSMLLYLPLSFLFWHAPALVHWQGIAPIKSLFFSLVACVRNIGAFTVFGLGWMAVFMALGLVMAVVSALLGTPELLGTLLFPLGLVMAAMFFTSLYFTFDDVFEAPAPDPEPDQSADR